MLSLNLVWATGDPVSESLSIDQSVFSMHEALGPAPVPEEHLAHIQVGTC